MSRNSRRPVADAELQARIEELERRLGTHEPMPEAQTLAASARETEVSAAEAQRARMTKEERKRQEKSARKAAMFMEKTELHPSKFCGVVGPQDRLIVPSYSINGGADIKWEARPSAACARAMLQCRTSRLMLWSSTTRGCCERLLRKRYFSAHVDTPAVLLLHVG